MRRYLARRLLLAVPTLIGITLVTFALSRMAPGGPLSERLQALQERGRTLTPEQIEQTRELLGLDRSLPAQYLEWLGRVARLDFGRSLMGDRRPVREKLWEAFRVSAVLQVLSILVIYLVAVPIGVWSAVRAGRPLERLTTAGLFLLYSVPNFFLAAVLILVFSGGRPFTVLPMHGLHSFDADRWGLLARAGDTLLHLILPVACLAYGGLATISRYARAGLLEVIRQDYVRTARAKGLPERVVIAKHALRNGIIPIVTLLATLLPYLLSGSVIVEYVFSIPGMGSLSYDAIVGRDYPTVLALSTLVGVTTLVGFLVADLLYVLLNPRIRLA